MLSRRVAAVHRPLVGALQPTAWQAVVCPRRHLSQAEVEDPNMNGGYVNPPRVKRQFRDPHADWWDKQERRNYGEPVHEDNDVLAIFSPHEYTHTPPGKGALQLLAFVAATLGLAGAISLVYPDRPAVEREFPDGLEEELGGKGAVRARKAGDEH